MPVIRFLERKDIDVDRWDQCVRNSPHGDVYALSAYLDIMAKNWGGLVQDDYAALLPVPWNRKYCIAYIYTPRFASPLPLCGDPVHTLPLAEFLSMIPKHFRLWDLDISAMPADQAIPCTRHFRNNHLLPLTPSHEQLRMGYRPSYRNLIRHCRENGYHARTCADFTDIIRRSASKKKIEGMKADDYARFERLCSRFDMEGMLQAWETVGPGGDRCAGAVFIVTQKKLYYLLAWNNAEGRKAGASHLLMDAVIASHAGSSLVLDFEGSDNPGIARFFEGFGAKAKQYLSIRKRSLLI
jgi:hypothetical protein